MDGFDEWLEIRTEDEPIRDGELVTGTLVGAFRVDALLGHGGFADVYRATGGDGQPVAIKILHLLDDRTRRRFERESEILAQVHHPNFPRLIAFGSLGERPYMVLELLKGGDLPDTDRSVARFLFSVMDAVEELHRRKWIHRDIKPANVLFRKDGQPVLIDFGLVCSTDDARRRNDGLSVEEHGVRVAVGTPGPSAPEQFIGQRIGPEADVHALGALIFDCFRGNVPKRWRQIYLTATNSNPKSRYHSVGELRQAVRRRNARWLAAGLLGASFVCAGLFALFIAGRAEKAPDIYVGLRQTEPCPMRVGICETNVQYEIRCGIQYRNGLAVRDDESGPPLSEKDLEALLWDSLRQVLDEEFGDMTPGDILDLYSEEGDYGLAERINVIYPGRVNERFVEKNLQQIPDDAVRVMVQAEDRLQDDLAARQDGE